MASLSLIACLLAAPLFAAEAPVRALMLVGPPNRVHDYEQEPLKLARMIEERLPSVKIEIDRDSGLLTAENIRHYGLLILNTCTQEPLLGLFDAVRNGMPLVIVHCGLAAEQNLPEYHRMIGGLNKTGNHAKFGRFCVEVTDPSNPIVQGLPQRFEIEDEAYYIDAREADVHLLLRTCNAYPAHSGQEPQVWVKNYGKGRVFTMSLGHNSKSQDDPNFQKLLVQGIAWALGTGR
jgi:type 1 glutamine amidotransferase